MMIRSTKHPRMFDRFSALAFSCMCLLVLGTLSGCGDLHGRVTASDAFDKLAGQSLNDDMDYVRKHVSATYFGDDEGKPVSDRSLRKLMDELRISRAVSAKETDSPDTMVLQIARTEEGKVVYSYVHMKRCEEKGWQLVGKPAPAKEKADKK